MFILSKLVGVLTDPFTLFYLAVGMGGLLLLIRRARVWGRRLLVGSFAVVTALAVFPVEQPMVEAWENRFPPPRPLPDHVDGIIVLGGGLNPAISAARGQPSINSAAARMTALIPLAKRYPDARLIFTGGSGSVLEQEFKEASYVKEFYEQIGFDAGRVIFESQSRNTRENAVFSKEIAAPKPGETWLLITSAFHMARSVGCFRAVGWPVVAYPVDYRTTGRGEVAWSDLRFSIVAGLGGMQTLAHEAMGLIGYRLSGWTDELLPHP
ncbi:YdcF family protein [Paramagnetospirillum kuznetsovii]|uniref:YdcF family protein n=1 Tax=Paramagnetospirillum kuznetsovii TaxID=2053833 RepID=A0A364NZX7_9PROT|nr:YdcF family protein [Paramagnetospirillum kuznetsovii]RAU22616.1 YdcF family protein [Paramagnetospirillum kuznetsovii]